MANMFCRLEDLGNESSVEQFFVSRLLPDMGYRDSQIKSKESLDRLVVSFGRTKVKYRPDYALKVRGKVRWVLDAKGTEENLDDWVDSCAGYCLLLNRRYLDEDPVMFFVLTNGITLRAYGWDRDDPILELDFDDFQEGNAKLKELYDLLGQKAIARLTSPETGPATIPTHTLRRKSIDEVNADFGWCHQHIYKKDNISQSAAFMEFVKVIFLKLLSDREVHRTHPDFARRNEITVPAQEVQFSLRWIEAREEDHPNPIAIQFQVLKQALEDEIRAGTKKRMFDLNEEIQLTPETIKGVVGRLEATDLFGIDVDLNGRLFEMFLSATMRGKDLGQYFTPRSIVNLMVALARPDVGRDHIDTVFDPACGTGGFLIAVLATTWNLLDRNTSLTDVERETLKATVAKDRIYGVDVGKNPPIARIARINMHLHGDGGSGIYKADSLDKRLRIGPTDSAELKEEIRELRDMLGPDGFCDIILTNPPFAKEYSRRHTPQDVILNDYELAFDTRGGRRKPRPSLLSKLMFLERYYDFLKPGGRVLAIVDDSILGSTTHRGARDLIREKYIIRAIISLPGDAFQRSRSRVKTSIIHLQKKTAPDEVQPPVFMYYCTSVGVDDSGRQRALPVDELNRREAEEEIRQVSDAFRAFLEGDSSAERWTVPPDAISDRLDVKHCLLKPGRKVSSWKQAGSEVVTLADLVEVKDDESLPEEDILSTDASDEVVTFIKVNYSGFVEPGDEKVASETGYTRLYKVHPGDIIISHLNAIHGAVGIVPDTLDGCVVSTEFTLLRARGGIDPRLVWMLMRSPEARSDFILLASGIGRHRVKWENARLLQVPLPPTDFSQETMKSIRKAEEMERAAREARKAAEDALYSKYGLDNEEAWRVITAFKPPR